MIPVRGGSPQIPDGVAYKDGNCWVIDVSMVAVKTDLNDAHLPSMTPLLSVTGAR